MNQQDFAQWVRYHGAVYPSFRKFLDDLSPLDRKDMLGAWFTGSGLDLISLEDAKEGSRRMMREKRPFHFDQHATEVCRLAVVSASERTAPQRNYLGPQFTPEGDRIYQCRYCLDTRGHFVHTVRPELVAWFERTYERPPFPSKWRRDWLAETPRVPVDGTLLCPCRHPGVTEVHYRDGTIVPVFNPERDCLCTYPIEEAVSAFVGSKIPVFPEGYFDE